MEALRRKPLIYLESTDTSKTAGDQEGIDYDFYADTDFADAENAAKFTRNEKQLEQLEMQHKLLEDFHKTHRISDFQHDALSSAVPLPEGARLTSVSQNVIAPYIKSCQVYEDNIRRLWYTCSCLRQTHTRLTRRGHIASSVGVIAWWSCTQCVVNPSIPFMRTRLRKKSWTVLPNAPNVRPDLATFANLKRSFYSLSHRPRS